MMELSGEAPTARDVGLKNTIAKDSEEENKRGVETQVESLSGLTLSELRVKWNSLHVSDAPDSLSPNMLKGAIAYYLQEQAFGGLSRQAQLRLKALMASPRNGSNVIAHTTLTKPGTKFLREWQNKVYEVQALVDGNFIFEGLIYRSLAIVAREITGTHQSGPKFFGLKRAKLKPMKEGKDRG
jgi:hypothetical protein